MAANKIQVGYIEAQDGAQFQVDAGTAAAPGLCFDDSAATGLYSPGTGQIAWSTSGKQTALRILADGKVGIDCSPTVALEVNGTIKASAIEAPIEGTLDDWIVHAGDTNTKFGFPDNDKFEIHAGGGPKLHIDTGGRVLLGSTSNRFYAAKLQVQGASDSNYIMMHNTTAGDANGNRYSKLIWSGTQSGGETSDLVHLVGEHFESSDDQKGQLKFRLNTGSNNHSPSEFLRLMPDGVMTLNPVNSTSSATLIIDKDGGGTGSLRFATATANTASLQLSSSEQLGIFYGGTEHTRFSSTGDIIVGNAGTNFGNAAVQAFSAHGNTAGESGFSSVDTTSVAAGVGGEITFHGKYNTGAQDYAYFGHIRGVKENATAGNTACSLKFFTRPDATAPQHRMAIMSNGSVNIGSGQLDQTDRLLNVYGGRIRISGIPNNSNSFEIYASATTGQSHGIMCQAGTNASDINATFRNTGGTTLFRIRGDGNVGVGIDAPGEKFDVNGWIQSTTGLKVAGHPLVTYAGFTDISGGSYAARLGSTGTSTIRSTQIYGGGGHIATFDGVNTRLGIKVTNPDLTLHVNGVNGLPATSGTTPVGHLTLRAKAQSASHGMYMGVSDASPWSSWIQAADAGNLGTEYPLLLNPRGGSVIVNATTRTSSKTFLEVRSGSSDTPSTGMVYFKVDQDSNYPALVVANASGGNSGDTMGIHIKNTAAGYGFRCDADGSGGNPFVIDAQGYVGINRTSPSTRLHIRQNNGVAYNKRVQTIAYNAICIDNASGYTSGGVYTGMQFNNTGDSQNRICSIGMVSKTNNTRHSDMVFATDDSGNREEKMRLTSNGTLHLHYAQEASPNTSGLTPQLQTSAGVVGPMFWMPMRSPTSGFDADGPGYSDMADGDHINFMDPEVGVSYNSMFQAGFFNSYSQPNSNTTGKSEVKNWNRIRIWARVRRQDSSTHTPVTVKFRLVTYHYNTGWKDQAQWDWGGTDSARGGRWVVSPWLNGSDFNSWADVPGFGLKYNNNGNSGVTVRIQNNVHFQFAYFN